MNLDQLLQRADIWRAGQTPAADGHNIPTGFSALDTALPGGGWPLGTLTEIISSQEGIGISRIVMPALAQLSRTKRWLAWVAPPHLPYAPTLAAAGIDLSRVLLVHPRTEGDGLWAVEQALRSGTCGAVLAWLAGTNNKTLRRLQLAAETGRCWGLLFRPQWTADQSSPASLRLRVQANPHGVAVDILKRRGGWAMGPLHLELEHAVAGSSSTSSAPGGPGPGRHHA